MQGSRGPLPQLGRLSEEQCQRGALPSNAGLEQALVGSRGTEDNFAHNREPWLLQLMCVVPAPTLTKYDSAGW